MITPDDDRLLWDDVAGELDATERERLVQALRASPTLDDERAAREQLSNDLRVVLRVDEPEPLSTAQRADVHQQALVLDRHRSSTRTWAWSLAACAALLLLSTTVYLGVIRPEQARISAERAAAEHLAAERMSEARRQEAESARALQQALEKAQQSAAMAAKAAKQYDPLVARKAAARPAAKPTSLCRRKPCASDTRSKAASGACDPNDPLCGL